MRTPRLAAAAALAVLVSTPPVHAADRKADAARTLRVLSHNVDGALNDRNGANGALSHTIREIRRWNFPDVVLLQEVCFHQLRYVDARLAGHGYRVAFSESRPKLAQCAKGAQSPVPAAETDPILTAPGAPTAAPADTDYGNAVLVRTAKGAAPALTDRLLPTGAIDPRDGKTVDKRRYTALCAAGDLASGVKNVTACAVHLAAHADNAFRKTQVRKLRKHLAGDVAAGRAVVVGGDFNAVPSASALDPLYHLTAKGGRGSGLFVEADETDKTWIPEGKGAPYRSGQPTKVPPGGRGKAVKKIDHIFFSNAGGLGMGGAKAANLHGGVIVTPKVAGVHKVGPPEEGGYSDHFVYRGRADIS
jgi:endonuclease/exonuclease/phosphatase family metal-dependent hydrolase